MLRFGRLFTTSRNLLSQRYIAIPLGLGAGLLTYAASTERDVHSFSYYRHPDDKNKVLMSLLSPREVESRLRRDEASYSVGTPNNPATRIDTNCINSNAPIEDDSAIVEVRSPGEQAKYLIMGVFDGHSGWSTSRYLAGKLLPYLAESLGSGDVAPVPVIRDAFLSFDDEICSKPIKEAREIIAKNLGASITVARQESQARLLNLAQPALSGSCALVSVVDLVREKLHVAVSGDCRAVLGQWTPQGWTVQSLSHDQTGLTPSEIDRLRKEHPGEDDTVVRHGRLLGHLQPTRAFGDARYKWTVPEYSDFLAAITVRASTNIQNTSSQRKVRGLPKGYLTPPYLTACPEIVSVDLKAPPEASADVPQKPPTTRFLIMATDGLFDELSNDQVVALVGAHIAGQKTPLTSADLNSYLAHPNAEDHAGKMHSAARNREGAPTARWAFSDSNIATHLIRNAFGGADSEYLAALLSIPSPFSRNYRDDVTVSVLFLDGDKPPGVDHLTLRSGDVYAQAKPKL